MAIVMVVDGGARGHALARAYLENNEVEKVIVVPGKEGMRDDRINGEIGVEQYRGRIIPDERGSVRKPNTILALAAHYKPDLIDVAQDNALALGTVELLEKEGFSAFGPTQAASRIESDKIWARDFMVKQGVATPEHRAFIRGEDSLSYALDLLHRNEHVFFKAAGLCEGKGVFEAHDEASARAAEQELAMKGAAGEHYLVETGLHGEEFSWHVIVSGEDFLSFPSSQDNKKQYNGDHGKNTGGLGAHTPALVTQRLERRIGQEIIKPIVRGLVEAGTPYRGILYLGGMYNETTGEIGVVEFNARWGDPECHVLLPSIAVKEGSTDYFTLVQDALAGNLRRSGFFVDEASRVSIVGACRGYPDEDLYRAFIGQRLWIERACIPEHVHFLSAGTGMREEKLYANGGRVFSCVGAGKDVIEARTRALQGIACCSIGNNGLHYRTDVAWRDVERLRAAGI
jgi:phosphoribosylamine--glycine ligase